MSAQAIHRIYNDRSIEPFRMVSDDLADQVVNILGEMGYSNATQTGSDSIDFIHQLLKAPPPNLSKENQNRLTQFLEQSFDVPAWVDFKRMDNGRKVYLRHAPLATMTMFLAGLIGSYSAAKGVKVLVRTGRLQTDILPRLYETAAMVTSVVAKDGLRSGHDGHRILMQVRLMHAGVRKYILEKHPQPWDFEWGHPINQEDMCGTLTLFSYVVLKGLETLGCYIPQQDKEDYIHLWRYAGYLLGCDDFFIPATYHETELVYSAVRRRQSHPDEDSRLLVHAVIDAVARDNSNKVPREMLYEISRYFIGDSLANKLEIPQHKFWNMLIQGSVPLWSVATFLWSNSGLLYGRLGPAIGDAFLNNRLKSAMGGGPIVYPIPGIAS